MTDTVAVVFLGAIALATVVMASIQVGAIVFAIRMAKRTESLVAKIEHDVAPVIERLTLISQDASRASSIAVQQVEKIDQLVTGVSSKVDRTLAAAERVMLMPAREGAAVAAALKAAVGSLREMRHRPKGSRGTGDDDDPLFIG